MNSITYLKLMRLHRPVGIGLLMFPSWWGVALASPGFPSWVLLLLFMCGAIFMRSAGCVYNDMVDQNLDVQVKRTASRPLASGEISQKEASFLFFGLLGASALILFSLPISVIVTGFIALGLVLLYPWMKRITYWPQFFLGVTFNIGVLMGWLSLQSSLSFPLLLFYAGGILWTLGYDTIYAFQDKDDDLLAGIKSSTLIVAPAPKLFISLVYGLSLVFWGLGGWFCRLKGIYWIFLSCILAHFIWQILTLKEKEPINCLKRFESNVLVGLFLFLGIVFSRWID